MAMTWTTDAARDERQKRTPPKSAAFRPGPRLSLLAAAALTALALSGCQSHPASAPPQPPASSVTTTDGAAPATGAPATGDAPPDSTTSDCAYGGDPLCPDTPVTVPPPDYSNPGD